MKKDTTATTPYSVLAEVYDEVMSQVDYEAWADFIHEIIVVHHPEAKTILELACGTGGLTLELAKMNGFEITATDKSPQMVAKAKEKTATSKSAITFTEADFLNIQLNKQFDVIFSVFDSVNYLRSEQNILKMLEQVRSVMKPNALYIFDFTTPLNSLEAINFLNNREGTTQSGWHYSRKSTYDSKQKIHYNNFDIKKRIDDGQTVVQHFSEKHKQRTYTLAEMETIVAESRFTIKAKYGEFDMQAADNNSHRITLVLQ